MKNALQIRKDWEDNALCLVHGDRLTVTKRGTWRCTKCLTNAGLKAAAARWGSKDLVIL